MQRVNEYNLHAHFSWYGLAVCECLRRPGFYCPTPALEVPCPPGAWCSQATVAPTTCEYPVLMKRFPDMTIPSEPLTVVQRVYANGEPLGGNICPPVSPPTSSTPMLQYLALCTCSFWVCKRT